MTLRTITRPAAVRADREGGHRLRALPWLAVAGVLALGACAGRDMPPAPVVHGGAERRTADGPGAAAPATVVVAEGDTVYSVAQRYGISVRALIETNRLAPPYRLSRGMRLTLPRPSAYVVRRGDTVYAISRRFGVDMSALVRANRIAPPYTILVGQTLRLPGTVAPAEPEERQMTAVAPTQPSPSVASLPNPVTAVPPAPQRVPPPPSRSGAGFMWPVQGRIVVAFGPQGGGQHNDGINIAVPRGAEIRAAESGVVAYAGNQLRGFGNLVLIRHNGGWTTAYAHNDSLMVRRGDTVARGQVIARAGATGSVSEPQLHFELRQGRRAVDPTDHLSLAQDGPVSRRDVARAAPPDPG